MNKDLYEMIFKRKSFHLFRNIGNNHLTEKELNDIEKEFAKFKPLVKDIKVKIKIGLSPLSISNSLSLILINALPIFELIYGIMSGS